MSEYETIKEELSEVKAMLKQLLRQQEPNKKEWVTAEEACKMLHIKGTTLASYRHKRMIDFRGPRPYHYSTRSIEQIQHDRTIKKAIAPTNHLIKSNKI